MEIKRYKLKITDLNAMRASFIAIFYTIVFICSSQQMPYYTQFKPSSIFLNPAVEIGRASCRERV